MERTCSWPWLNKFFERQTGGFTSDWERLGLGEWPDDFAKNVPVRRVFNQNTAVQRFLNF